MIKDKTTSNDGTSFTVDPEKLVELGIDPELAHKSPAMAIAQMMMNRVHGGQANEAPTRRVRKPENEVESPENPTATLVRSLLTSADELKKKQKRKPLMADRFLQMRPPKEDSVLMNRKHLALVKDGLVQAHRYVFDAQATQHIGNFIKRAPEIIASAQEFAMLPFPITYVELPMQILWKTINDDGTPDPHSDTGVAYLYHGPNVYVMSENDEYDTRDVGLMPYHYRMNVPFKPEEEEFICSLAGWTKRETIDAMFWGSSHTILDPETAMSLRANHSLHWNGPILDTDRINKDYPALFSDLFRFAGGDLRNIIAILLFLNQTDKIEYGYKEMPTVRGMIGTKPSAFLKHSIITVHVDPTERLITHYGKGVAGKERRNHPVRAHFCHDKTVRASNHLGDNDWRNGHTWVERGVNQWRCMLCNGVRWRRKEHRRGKLEKGMTDPEYRVTK